jgi:hypothetical protein
VRDEQSVRRQPDISLDTAKAAIERIEKRPRVLIIVVRVRWRQRLDRRPLIRETPRICGATRRRT